MSRIALGCAVVQVYRDAPETALFGFSKDRPEAGESRRVQIPLTCRRFLRWSDGGW